MPSLAAVATTSLQDVWHLWIAALKNSSRSKLGKVGSLSNAALIFPRNTLNFKKYIYKQWEMLMQYFTEKSSLIRKQINIYGVGQHDYKLGRMTEPSMLSSQDNKPLTFIFTDDFQTSFLNLKTSRMYIIQHKTHLKV